MNLLPQRAVKQDSVLESLRGEFNQLFDRFWSGELEPLQIGRWSPALDVSETDEAVIVRAETPGLEPQDVDISVEGDVLTIKGEKKEDREEKEQNFHRVERRYGAFVRSIRLPAPVVSEKADAVFKNGVLRVSLPKQEEAKPRKVKISVE